MQIHISGWSRNQGNTVLMDADFDSDISRIKPGDGIKRHELSLVEYDNGHTNLMFGPRELNLHGNYAVTLEISKAEILALAIKTLEDTPFAEVLSGVKRLWLDKQDDIYRLTKLGMELQAEKTAHNITKLRLRNSPKLS